MTLRSRVRTVAAGQVDSGLSSLATFAVQVYATNLLSGDQLGAYSLLFSSSLLAAQIAALLVFAPTDVLATQLRREDRLVGLHATVRWGASHALPAALLAGLGAIPAVDEVDHSVLLKLVVGAVVFAFFTPIQDHIRTMLHVSGRSADAAKVSFVQLIALVGAALLLHTVDPVLVPFGALALANLASGTFGLVRIGAAGRGRRRQAQEVRHLGHWLFGSGAVHYGFSFLSSLVLERLIGLTAVGILEAARVVARPVWVVGFGLNAIVAPRAREAVTQKNWPDLLRLRHWFWLGVFLSTIAYLALVGFPWTFNPMTQLIPLPYGVTGLVAASIVALSLGLLPQPLEAQLLAASREKRLAGIAAIAGLLQLITSLSSVAIGLFAGPASLGAAAIGRLLLLLQVSKEMRSPVPSLSRSH